MTKNHMNQNRVEKGRDGEELAAAYLESKGYLISDRNYRFGRNAEVDIVAFDEIQVIFVEVKKRTSIRFGQPEESVTPQKIAKIKRAAEAWIYERRMDTALIRFDVITILQKGNEAPDIRHIEDAFR